MRRAVVCVAVLVVAALAAGCGGRGAAPPHRPEPPVAEPTPGESPGDRPPAGARTVVTVVGKDNFYEPATVAMRVAQEYEIHFRNEGTTVHNMIFQTQSAVGRDFASDIAVNPGAESVFNVRIDRDGTFRIVCTYHPEMVGDARVTR
jgi:plastocyanin